MMPIMRVNMIIIFLGFFEKNFFLSIEEVLNNFYRMVEDIKDAIENEKDETTIPLNL